jgi:hypothetical protein
VALCRYFVNPRFGGTYRLHLQGRRTPWAMNQCEKVAVGWVTIRYTQLYKNRKERERGYLGDHWRGERKQARAGIDRVRGKWKARLSWEQWPNAATGYDPGSIPSGSNPHSLLCKIYLNLPSHLFHCLQFPKDSPPKFCMHFSSPILAAWLLRFTNLTMGCDWRKLSLKIEGSRCISMYIK